MDELSPNTRLAQEIADLLTLRELVPASQKAALLNKLETGTAKEEDWRLWAEQVALKDEAVAKDA